MTMLLTSDTSHYDINAPIFLHWESSQYKMDLKFFVCKSYLKCYRVFKSVCKYSGVSNTQKRVMSQLYRLAGPSKAY